MVERNCIESAALELDKYVLIGKIQKTKETQYTFCILTNILVSKILVDTGISERERLMVLF